MFTDFIIFWLVTIIITKGMNLPMIFFLVKIIADNGYKIDLSKAKQVTESFKEYVNNSKIIDFIPVANILQTTMKMVNLKNKEALLINQLRIMDVLENFTDEELNNYSKNPTIFNAFLIMSNFALKEESIEEETENSINNNETRFNVDEAILSDNEELRNLQSQKEKLLQEKERLIEAASQENQLNSSTKTYQKKK